MILARVGQFCAVDKGILERQQKAYNSKNWNE
jgi:hypothetical protein